MTDMHCAWLCVDAPVYFNLFVSRASWNAMRARPAEERGPQSLNPKVKNTILYDTILYYTTLYYTVRFRVLYILSRRVRFANTQVQYIYGNPAAQHQLWLALFGHRARLLAAQSLYFILRTHCQSPKVSRLGLPAWSVSLAKMLRKKC